MKTKSATGELTSVELTHFHTFGFITCRGFFPAAEMEQISRDYDDVMDANRGGAPFVEP